MNQIEPQKPSRSFRIMTFVGLFMAAMLFLLISEDSRNIGVALAPFFPLGLLVGIHFHSKQPGMESVMIVPYIVYVFTFFVFCVIKSWKWYWVAFATLICLLLVNVAGCHKMLNMPH